VKILFTKQMKTDPCLNRKNKLKSWTETWAIFKTQNIDINNDRFFNKSSTTSFINFPRTKLIPNPPRKAQNSENFKQSEYERLFFVDILLFEF
jgi:hypothetical protein